MANYGSKTITINVDCNTSQAEAKVTSLADSVKRIEKNGKIHLTAEVNKSNLNQIDNLVKDKKIKFSLDADSLKDLQSGLNQLTQHPNLYKSVEKDLARYIASLKNQTRGVFDDLISVENSKELDSITKKIQKLYANPKRLPNGDYETTWLTKLRAYMQRYRDLKGDMDATFTSQGGRNKSAKSIVNDLQNSKAYQGYDIGQYSEIMSKLESAYNNTIQKIKQLRKQSLKDLSPESMEELLQMPKFDYNALNEFYTKAIKQQLTAKQNEVKPQISVEEIRNELTAAFMDIPVTLKVDDEIARIKSSLATIPVNLNCDDDIARIRTQIGSTFVDSSGKTITKKNQNNDNLTNTGMQIKLSVTPSVDSVKKSIQSIPKSKTVSINIKTGDSLKNLKKLTQGLNDYDLQGTIKNLKSISQSFNYAFRNVNQAANAPMKILQDMNNEVLRLKKNLNEVGVKKFSESKTMNKQLESYKKQAVTEAKNAANETLKEAKQYLSDAKKTEKRNEKLEAKNAKLKQDVTDLKAKHKEELTTLKEGSGEEGSSKKWSEANYKKLSTAKDVLKDYAANDYNVISDVKAELDKCKTTAESIVETFTNKKLGDLITNDERMQLVELDEKIKQIKDYKKAENLILNSNGELIQHQAEFANGFGNATDVDKIKAVTEALKAEGIEAKNLRKVNSQKDMYDYTIRVGDKEVTQRAYLDSASPSSKQAGVRVATRQIEQYQTAGEKWLSSFKAKFTNLAQYIAGAEIQNQILAQVKQGISFVKEYDSALTNIGMTMQATQGQLQNLGKEAISTGQELGTSATDVIDAAKIYANANETTESVLQKSQATIKLKNASGQDISTVADQVQGVINQFDGMEGQETRIVNSLEKISAGLGIDFAKGINIMSDATQTAGSVANEAGLSFEQYAASVGKISEMTRLEGSTIGNAYKTIMARISRSKSADSDVSDADRSNAAKALASVNISTYDNQGNFKDLEEILDELSGKWTKLSDAQKNYIAEQAAGVRNINTFKALMGTWGESKELAKDAMDDTNFIDEVQDKYMDSVEGKMNKAKANIQDFFNTIISAGNIGTVVTGFNGITGALNAMIKTAQKLPGIGNTTAKVMTGFIGVVSSGLFNSLTKANNELKQDDDLKGKYGIFDVFKKAGSTFKADFHTLGTKENAEGRENGLFSIFKNAFKDYKSQVQIVSQSNSQLESSFQSLKTNIAATGEGITTTWHAMTGFSKVLTGITAAMLGFELVSKVIDYYSASVKKAKDAVGKASSVYKSQTSTLKKNKDTVSSLKDEWSNLSKGVNTSTNENVSLTSSEYERYLELNKQIADIIPETISGYDAQGNAILKVKGNVESLNAALEKQEVLQANNRIVSNADAYENLARHISGQTSGWEQFSTSWDQGLPKFLGLQEKTSNDLADQLGNQKAIDFIDKVSKYKKKDFNKIAELLSDKGGEGTSLEGDYLKSIIEKVKDENGKSISVKSYADWKKILNSGELEKELNKQQQVVKANADTNKQLLNDYITTFTKGDGEFSNLSEEVSNNIATLLTKVDNDTITELTANGGLEKFARDYFSKISKSKDAQNALSNLLGIGKEDDITKIQSVLKNDLTTLSKTLGVDKKTLELQ